LFVERADDDEHKWIVRTCRKAWDEYANYKERRPPAVDSAYPVQTQPEGRQSDAEAKLSISSTASDDVECSKFLTNKKQISEGRNNSSASFLCR